jgi:steroid delta-isomerase-like uncharacterized protein
VPATGKRFTLVRRSSILELEAGKIRRKSGYWDAAMFMKQVGRLVAIRDHLPGVEPKETSGRSARRRQQMSNSTVGDAAIAVVRRNTEEVQGKGNWDLYEELFADDFVDHTPQPGTTPDKDGVRVLYKGLRAAFPDFRPEIHWQVAAGDIVTTYKTYHGTHQGEFLGIPATGKKVSFYTVDAMRVVDGKITEHWGVATLLDLMQQLGVVPPLGSQR